MQYEQVRDMLLQQWTYTGGPNEAKASELYHDDVVLEFPQSDEWFRGRASQQAWRERFPARLDFQPREITVHFVKIIEFRGEKVHRETLYFTEPFPAPEWRRPWAETEARPRRHDDLPEHVLGGQ